MHPWIWFFTLSHSLFFARSKFLLVYFWRPYLNSLQTKIKLPCAFPSHPPHKIGKIKKNSSQASNNNKISNGNCRAERDIHREAKPQYNSEWLGANTIKNNKLSNEKGSCLKVWLETDFFILFWVFRFRPLSSTNDVNADAVTNEIIFHQRFLFREFEWGKSNE